MNLLELIDAHAAALFTSYRGNTQQKRDAARDEHTALRAEIERRIALAKNDVSDMFACHLDDDTHSQDRQREVIRKHAVDVAAGRRPDPIVEHCRKDL